MDFHEVLGCWMKEWKKLERFVYCKENVLGYLILFKINIVFYLKLL